MPLENRLKEHRARLGINQADMGKRAGVSRQTMKIQISKLIIKKTIPHPISMKLPMGNLYILSEATQVFITSEQYKQTRIRKYWIN